MTKAQDKQIEELTTQVIELKAQLSLLTKLYEKAQRSAVSTNGSDDPEAPLSRLTLKQHAVLLGELADVEHEEMGRLMKADVSTIKLHLRAAMVHLGAQNRNHLALKWKPIVDSIDGSRYRAAYGIDKRWWETKERGVMQELQAKKSTLAKK